jgi:mono/diheme cytochrome c family protein
VTARRVRLAAPSFGMRILARCAKAHPTVLLLLSLVACTRGSTSDNPPIHLNPNMDDQPRYEAQASSDFFYDGKAMRTPVAGTVARGALAESAAFATGMVGGAPVDASPIPVGEELLARGGERYAIYCGPCHAENGDGESMLKERSGVATADLTQDRLLTVGDGYLFDVITHGFGLMPGYAYPIPPEDRWAIVAWVRKLQSEREPPAATPEAEAAVDESAEPTQPATDEGATDGEEAS